MTRHLMPSWRCQQVCPHITHGFTFWYLELYGQEQLLGNHFLMYEVNIRHCFKEFPVKNVEMEINAKCMQQEKKHKCKKNLHNRKKLCSQCSRDRGVIGLVLCQSLSFSFVTAIDTYGMSACNYVCMCVCNINVQMYYQCMYMMLTQELGRNERTDIGPSAFKGSKQGWEVLTNIVLLYFQLKCSGMYNYIPTTH